MDVSQAMYIATSDTACFVTSPVHFGDRASAILLL